MDAYLAAAEVHRDVLTGAPAENEAADLTPEPEQTA